MRRRCRTGGQAARRPPVRNSMLGSRRLKLEVYDAGCKHLFSYNSVDSVSRSMLRPTGGPPCKLDSAAAGDKLPPAPAGRKLDPAAAAEANLLDRAELSHL